MLSLPIVDTLISIWHILQYWVFSTGWVFAVKFNDIRADKYRKLIWPDISGHVLEVGPGFAGSLKFLAHSTKNNGAFAVDPTVVYSYTALEPNPFMYEKMQQNAETNGFGVEYDPTTCVNYAEKNTPLTKQEFVPFNIVCGTLDDPYDIPQAVLDKAPFDSILTSFSLCTARDPQATLANIQKLLKTGGTFYFIEHVRQPGLDDPTVIENNGVNGTFWGNVQDWATPIWKIIGHGCYLNRRTGLAIAGMKGWSSVEYQSVRLNNGWQAYIMPISFGKAVKLRCYTS